MASINDFGKFIVHYEVATMSGEWMKLRFKYCFELVTEKATNSNDLKIALENIESWSGKYLEGEGEYQGEGVEFRAGDILFGKLRPYLAKVLLTTFNGSAVGDFFVFRSNERVSPKYAFYCILNKDFISIVNGSTFGAKMPRASWEFISNLEIPLPPLPTQHAISSFLDLKTSLIDSLIRKTERKIELLNEYRTALINHVVTKGLTHLPPEKGGTKGVKMKESGVEWIGEIPEHWECVRISRLTTVKRGASPRPIEDPKYFDDNGEYAWVRISDVSASERYLERTTQTLSDLGSSLSVKMHPGSLFLSIAGSVGKPIITRIKCCIHDGFVYFPELKINNEFLYFIFITGQPYKGLGKWGTQLNLNTETVGAISIPLPPQKEIENIIEYLNGKLNEIDSSVLKEKSRMEILKEYRQSLISAAVTGKIDVSKYAVHGATV